MKKKAIIFVRVSTEAQSYDAQKEELIKYALSNGYAMEDLAFVENKESAISLPEDKREGLNEMKKLIEAGEIGTVFVWEISRIARNLDVLFSIRNYLKKRRIQLRIYKPEIKLLDETTGKLDPIGSMAFTLYAQLSEIEMENKKERFARAKREGFDKGKYMGGKYLTGYTVNEAGYWEIDSEGRDLVRTVFALYNSNEYSMTELAKELKSRGYFPALTITNTKNELHHMLRNEIYIGQRKNNNIYPQIIDKETFEKCAKLREAKKCKPVERKQYLLTPLIHCSCGSSYSFNAIDGTYNCRVRHNAVEKGLIHTPAINGNLIESLAWWVALHEMAHDLAIEKQDARKSFENDIILLQQKIAVAEKDIHSVEKRREKLDEDYYVHGTLSEERYLKLSGSMTNAIGEAKERLRTYTQSIKDLEMRIADETTFDDLLNSLSKNFDSLANGTEDEIMRKIIRRYITNINIYPRPGKKTSWWKIVDIHTIHDNENATKIEELKKQGLEEIARTLSNHFIVDTYHHIVYWNEELTEVVPCILLNRVSGKRKDKRKNRKRKPTIQKQY